MTTKPMFMLIPDSAYLGGRPQTVKSMEIELKFGLKRLEFRSFPLLRKVEVWAKASTANEIREATINMNWISAANVAFEKISKDGKQPTQ